jgi:hypothetical protein
MGFAGFAVLLLVAAVAVSDVSAIQCYTCIGSKDSESCRDQLAECPTGTCQTSIVVINGKQTVTRSCAESTTCEAAKSLASESCGAMKPGSGGTDGACVCCCTGDKCNGSCEHEWCGETTTTCNTSKERSKKGSKPKSCKKSKQSTITTWAKCGASATSPLAWATLLAVVAAVFRI